MEERCKWQILGGTYGRTTWIRLHEVWRYVSLRPYDCLYLSGEAKRRRDTNSGACTSAVGPVDKLRMAQKHLQENYSVRVERAVFDLEFFAMRSLTFDARAGGSGAGAKKAGEIKWSFGAIGVQGWRWNEFRAEGGTAEAFMCACGWLRISGSLASAYHGGERGRLSRLNCTRKLDLRTNLSSKCRPSKCMVAWDSCRAVFGGSIVPAQQILLMVIELYIEAVAVSEWC